MYKRQQPTLYVLDTNVLIHDPNALLNFQEHRVAIPMTVLEELDKLKTGKHTIAAECRQAIRLIDQVLGEATPEQVEGGVPIQRGKNGPSGSLSILMSKRAEPITWLPEHLNDNKIINQLVELKSRHSGVRVVLVTKDINMRLKARACGVDAEDYHTDQLIDDVALLSRGYHSLAGSFWDRVSKVETRQDHGRTWHRVQLTDNLPAVHINEFIVDEQGFVGWIKGIQQDELTILDLHQEPLLHQEAWGLRPRDVYQSLALYALLDPDIHLVNLSGAAGSGKTILALAAAIEQTMVSKRYRRIIATRSVQGLDEDIGFLPGTEAEKMEPWLGAITDNLEALHMDDECTHGSVDYILSKVPLQFKSLNYIRGRSFQQSLILIDECQNLTPHQMKTIITRAGSGSKVICLGNLAQIDTPYLSATSSGLTYLTERFKDFPHGVHVTLQGVPRSVLAEYAEAHM
ncbi:PhoH family protein [Pseudomonas aeruginosa]|uniref:PhoH family protein n=1 Tax=Pseudomonas aeruginosa TaxID=287 RepID=UPI000657B12C|nr:PhoH family protein [Pseudomonas aeruginosa]MCO1826604.1 PhoH family protein [Pseudomonas aeruginosa]MCO1955111.1 PhoH family protein [Pseudomonas aeruginosa]MCO2028187.1 PhoH family protein [Pseudomonas aeruginosa]MCO2803796.1 PhoH family protein [Pseudomonas aeruginosa]MCO3424812.1 PhoH family protein [Pseudomonas aeruginosa]